MVSLPQLRGSLIFCRDDPVLTDPAKAFVHEPDGLVICRDGLIEKRSGLCGAQGGPCRRTSSLPIIPAP